MNIIERASYFLGRTIGGYGKGIQDAFSTTGARPSVGDQSAWADPYEWGSYLLDSKKPSTKSQFVNNNLGWVFICVKLNFQTVGSQRLRLYVSKETKGKKYATVKTRPLDRQRLKWLYTQTALDTWLTKAEEIEEVTDHAYLDLMKDVNPYHGSRELKELTTMFMDLTGECYWLMLKDGLGVPRQLWVIPSQFINPDYGSSLKDAIKGYVYKRGNVELTLKAEDVVMFNTPNPKNIFSGFSTIKGVADAVYIQSQMNEFETSIFENMARVGGVIEEVENVGLQQRSRFQEKLSQKHTGPKKAGKMMYLPRGLKYTKDAMTPVELNFIEGRKGNMMEICTSLDVPVGMFDPHSNRAVAEAAGYQHSKIGILPRCDRFSEKMNERILPLFDEKLFCAFDDPVPKNRELALKESVQLVVAGIKATNEDRAERGLEAVKGGDEPLVDSRRIPLSMAGIAPKPGEEEEQVLSFSKKVTEKIKEMLG